MPSPRSLVWMLACAIAVLAGCGASRSSIDLPPGHLRVAVGALDLGAVECGAKSGSFQITLSNDEVSSVVAWSAEVDAPFVIDGAASGTITFGKSSSVGVRVDVPSGAIVGAAITGQLRLRTVNSGRPLVTVPLTVAPRGAMVRVATPLVDFGDIPVGATSPPIVATLVNDGDAPASVALAGANDPELTVTPTALVLAPGASADVAVRFSPKAPTPFARVLPIAISEPRCGVAPELGVRGNGTNGALLVSPGTVDFGLVDCGSMAQPKTFSVTNTGKVPAAFAAKLTEDGWFAIASSAGSLGPGDTATITLTPLPVPKQRFVVKPGAFDATVSITSDLPLEPPHTVAVRETGRGVVLSAASVYRRALVDEAVTLTYPVTNEGNVPVTFEASSGSIVSIPPVQIPATTTMQVPLVATLPPSFIARDAYRSLTFTGAASAPICDVTLGDIIVRGYDRALTVAPYYGPAQACVVGHHGHVYCNGFEAGNLSGQNLSWQSPMTLVDANAAGIATLPSPCLIGPTSMRCLLSPIQTFSVSYPSTAMLFPTRSGSERQLCIRDGANPLTCVGYLDGVWSSTLSMMGNLTDVADFDSSIRTYYGVACAARSDGTVWCRGHVDGSLVFVDPPQAVPGVVDAVAVAAGPTNDLFLIRQGGQIAYGAVNVGVTDVAGAVNAAQVEGAEGNPGDFCFRSATGTVACRVKGVLAPVQGLSLPVVKLSRGFPDLICALEATGRVMCWTYTTGAAALTGFEGP